MFMKVFRLGKNIAGLVVFRGSSGKKIWYAWALIG